MSTQFFGMLSHGLQGFFKTHTPVVRLFGQSNARGSNNLVSSLPVELQTEQLFKIWVNGTFENYNPNINSEGSIYSVEPYIGQWVEQTFSEKLHIIKYGEGGTTLGINPLDPLDKCWLPTGFELYDNWKTLITAAYGFVFDKPPVVIADIWIQGESDAADGSDYYSVYEANQRTLISTYRNDSDTIISNAGYSAEQAKFMDIYGLDKIPFIDVQLSSNTIYPQVGVDAVQLAKININNDALVSDTFLVDTTQAQFVDGQHYTPDSIQNILSAQMIGFLETLYLK